MIRIEMFDKANNIHDHIPQASFVLRVQKLIVFSSECQFSKSSGKWDFAKFS